MELGEIIPNLISSNQSHMNPASQYSIANYGLINVTLPSDSEYILPRDEDKDSSDSEEEAILMRIKPGQDCRKSVKDTTIYPYSAHGRVVLMLNGELSFGTGTLISTRHVLTAAHNLYFHRFKRHPDSISFIPALNGTNIPYGIIKVKRFFYPKEYKSEVFEDYGILELEEDIGESTGFIEIRSHTAREIESLEECSIYGYPSHINGQINYHLYGMECKVSVEGSSDLLRYELDTSHGQSGSGIYYYSKEDHKYYTIGVHVRGIQGSHNEGTFLTTERIDQINRWIERKMINTEHNLKLYDNQVYGRDQELEIMRDSMRLTDELCVITLYGVVGVGKSAIALKFASEAIGNYDTIMWIDCETEETLLKSLSGLGYNTDIEDADYWDMLLNLKQYIDYARTSFLIILDDLEDVNIGRMLLTENTENERCHYIITTRLRFQESELKGIKVEVSHLSMEASVQLLYSKLPSSDHSLNEIVELANYLEGIPLALVGSARYINYLQITIQDLILNYSIIIRRSPFLKNILSKNIGYLSEESKNILWMICRENDESISYDILYKLFTLSYSEITHDCFKLHIDNLVRISLLISDSSNQVFKIYRFIKVVSRLNLVLVNEEAKDINDLTRLGSILNEDLNTEIKNLLNYSFEKEYTQFNCQKPIIDQLKNQDRLEKRYSSMKESLLVQGKDRRDIIKQTEIWPYCVHGKLVCQANNGWGLIGSGTMIGPHVVLTCAHAVWSKGSNKKYDKSIMTFYPALNGHCCPYGGARILEVYYPEEFETKGKEDYAILVLDRRIGDYTGYFGIKEISRISLIKRNAYLYGYQTSSTDDINIENYLRGMEGLIEEVTSGDRIYHSIDTQKGQSGSAICIKEDDRYQVVGIHISGAKQGRNFNTGIYLNQARIDRIKGWITDFSEKYSVVTELDSSMHQELYKLWIRYNSALIDWSNLAVLNLSDRSIGCSCLKILAQLMIKNLRILNLSNNQIEDDGAITISQSKFIKLTELDLSNNRIGDRGAYALSEGNFISLANLDLSNNSIGNQGAIGLSQANFHKITTLYLASNIIGDEGATSLSQANFTNMTTLDLSYNNIGQHQACILSKAKFIILNRQNSWINQITSGGYDLSMSSYTSSNMLNLSGHQIGDRGVTTLSQSDVTNLVSLDLSSNCIGDAGATALAQGSFFNLETLDLSNNQIGNEGVNMICQSDFKNLRILDLSKNALNNTIILELYKASFIYLTSLNLSENPIGINLVIWLSICTFKNLCTLHLRDTNIGADGARVLSQVKFKHLKLLDLSANKIGDKGASSLSKGKLKYLEDLKLSDNQINAVGATSLSEANFTELCSLNLSLNNIGDYGATALSKGKLINLTALDLSSNNIGDEGAISLSQGSFINLNTLNLSANQIGNEVILHLRSKLPQVEL